MAALPFLFLAFVIPWLVYEFLGKSKQNPMREVFRVVFVVPAGIILAAVTVVALIPVVIYRAMGGAPKTPPPRPPSASP